MQAHIEESFTTHTQTQNSSKNNLYCFLGGFIVNLIALNEISFKNDLHYILTYILSADFISYIIRSIMGGFVALLFKLLYDVIKFYWSKNKGGNNGTR